MAFPLKRRQFLLKTAFATGLIGTFPFRGLKSNPFERYGPAKLKLSLNTYSFNSMLREGKIDLFDLVQYCAEKGFSAVDPTGYYFPGYPETPTDNYINKFKREVFLNGLEVSGTGVRNDFTQPDQQNRQADLQHIKDWILVASKMGAPLLRVFARRELEPGRDREEAKKWVIEGLRKSAEFGEQHGVMIALQNHNEFLKTAEEVESVLKAVGHPWLGLHLDIGSLQSTDDPYQEIKKLVPYAITWQIKEIVYRNGAAEETDYEKVIKIAKESGYRGYFPLETLGAGDPYVKVERMINKVRMILDKMA